MRLSVLCAGAVLASSLCARADTLASFNTSSLATTSPNYLGEKFTTGGTGAYSSIVFNFINGGNPYAIGTGFLLSQQYLGAPGSLGSSTAGYLGSVAASSNHYTFGSNVVLQGGGTYYLYENALAPGGISGDYVAGTSPEYYYATSTGNFTGQTYVSLDFSVTGSPLIAAATPEPSSFALLGTGLLGLGGMLRRRVL